MSLGKARLYYPALTFKSWDTEKALCFFIARLKVEKSPHNVAFTVFGLAFKTLYNLTPLAVSDLFLTTEPHMLLSSINKDIRSLLGCAKHMVAKLDVCCFWIL